MKNEKQRQLLIEQLKKTPIIGVACEKNSVGRSTLYRWKKEDKEFAKAVEEAIIEGEALITDMTESQLISLIRDRNFSAIQLWLRHHHPKYTNRIEVDASVKNVDEELSPQQEAIIREALKLASLSDQELINPNQQKYEQPQ